MKNGPYEMIIPTSDYPGKLYRGRYCYEHHFVWWKHNGQIVSDGFQMHHKDGNKRNNSIENLELLKKEEHEFIHSSTKSVKMYEIKCPVCEVIFYRRTGHVKKGSLSFCSSKCLGIFNYPGNGKPKSVNQELKKCRRNRNGLIEFPPYKNEEKSEFYRPMVSELKKQQKEENDKIERLSILEGDPIYKCKKCGKPRDKNLTFCSEECAHESRKKFEISKEELSKIIWEIPTIHIAKIYGVSDHAISKRCKKFGIEKPPRGHWTKSKIMGS